MIDFKEAREQILKIGIDNIIESGDQTEINFVLKNGKTLTLYTTEIELYDENDKLSFGQSELRFMKGDLA